MDRFDSVCAVLCLMTRAAADEETPPPLSRPAMSRLLAGGALSGADLRDTPLIEPALMERCERLLSRSKAVYACLEWYREQGYDVILPQDARWPRRLLALGERMPRFLFVRGDIGLLRRRAIAVAGSRAISGSVADASRALGRRIAQEGFALVSGCARGVDTAAEEGAIEAGGCAVLVPAQHAGRILTGRRLDLLAQGRLLLVMDALPDDPFSAQRAIARNHTIYALGEAAVAVAPREGAGGTWHGACDCLSMGASPVFVPEGEELGGAGAQALIGRGARRIDLSLPLAAQIACPSQTRLDI